MCIVEFQLDYQLNELPLVNLFQRLQRRLKHLEQTIRHMSSNDIEIKLIYKRDGRICSIRVLRSLRNIVRLCT
jgi:hypothetical protein